MTGALSRASRMPIKAVAIDGPAASGKSTVGRELARRLGWSYVETGAMYRAVTLKALREGIDLGDVEALAGAASRAMVELREGPDGVQVLLDGEDVTEAIRDPGLTRRVRLVASMAGVRSELVRKQRELAEAGPAVMEGRDIGTVVLPDAAAKFFLDASLEERAARRARDLGRAGEADVDPSALARELESRDRSDREREVGPLALAADAERVDTTGMSIEAVVARLEERVREKLEDDIEK